MASLLSVIRPEYVAKEALLLTIEPPAPAAPVPLIVSALEVESVNPFKSRVPPSATVTPEEDPSAPVLPITRVPAEMLMEPVNMLAFAAELY